MGIFRMLAVVEPHADNLARVVHHIGKDGICNRREIRLKERCSLIRSIACYNLIHGEGEPCCCEILKTRGRITCEMAGTVNKNITEFHSVVVLLYSGFNPF